MFNGYHTCTGDRQWRTPGAEECCRPVRSPSCLETALGPGPSITNRSTIPDSNIQKVSTCWSPPESHPWTPFFICQNRPTLLLVKCAIMKGMLEERVMGFHSSYSKTSVKNTRNQSSHSNTNLTLTLVIEPIGICAGCILQTERVRVLMDAIDIIKTSEGEIHDHHSRPVWLRV